MINNYRMTWVLKDRVHDNGCIFSITSVNPGNITIEQVTELRGKIQIGRKFSFKVFEGYEFLE